MIRRFSLIARDVNLYRSLEKTLSREHFLADKYYREGSKQSLRKLLTLVRKCKEANESSSRIAAYGAFLAVKQGCITDSIWCLSKITNSPVILKRSLSIYIFLKQEKIDDALDEMEAILNEEDAYFNSINSKIPDEILDMVHSCIKASTNTQNQMKRFRRIQKAITQYEKRTDVTLENILSSPVFMESVTCERANVSSEDISNKIIEQIPHFMVTNGKQTNENY